MPTLLITGFEPFGSSAVNPSWEAVKRLPEVIGQWRLVKKELPVVFGEATAQAVAAANACGASAVLCVGQHGGVETVNVEAIGVNLRHAPTGDGAGNCYWDAPIDADGPAAYFATVPYRAMAEAVKEKGIPARVSLSAGAYVCNDTLYGVSRAFVGTAVRVGFIHVPGLPEQTELPCRMPLADMIAALTAAVEAM